MKTLLLVSIFFILAIIVPGPKVSWADIKAGISLPPVIVETPPEFIMMSDTRSVYVVAVVDANTPQSSLTDRDEMKQESPSLEKGKPTGSEDKSNWKINVQPVQPPDNVKSLPERQDENKSTPPDRF